MQWLSANPPVQLCVTLITHNQNTLKYLVGSSKNNFRDTRLMSTLKTENVSKKATTPGIKSVQLNESSNASVMESQLLGF